MDGDLLKNKIIGAGFELAEVARLLSISPQNLQSKLNSKDIKVGFVKEISKCINKSVYYLLDIEEPRARMTSERPKERDTSTGEKLKEGDTSINYQQKIGYLEAVVEAQKGNLDSKDMLIKILQEALREAKALLEEHGLSSASKRKTS